MRHSIIYILFFWLLCPVVAEAQRFDAGTLEALINDHKKLRGPMLSRTALEVANKELHDDAREEVMDYKDVNDKLDKYLRVIDWLNIAYEGLSTVMHFKMTYDDIKEKGEGIYDLLERYRVGVLKRQEGQLGEALDIIKGVGDIHSIGSARDWYNDAKALYEQGPVVDPRDTIIFVIGRDMVFEVRDKCKEIYKSASTLVLYATGASQCTTEGLMITIRGLDNQMTDLRNIIDRAYFQLWRYIHLRTGYWSKAVMFQHKTTGEYARDALHRWRNSTYEALRRH